jgi:hypothetical protein
MSLPPPSSSREFVLELEAPRGRVLRRAGEDRLRLGAYGATFECERMLRAPLQLPLGVLQLGVLDPGPPNPGGMTGRFPVLRRLSATAVIPREHGVEGWLWTSTGGSALTLLCGDDAPNAGLLFTKPLGEDVLATAFDAEFLAALAARSPLGAPSVYGLLFRVARPTEAEGVFRQFGLLRPLSDREVPPALRRSLPTDRPADPRIAAGDADRAATSVAPPGMG